MKIAGVVCAFALASLATVAAQTPTLSARRINLLVVENTTFESMMKVLGELSGVAIEFDETVPTELRMAPIGRLHFEDTELESALGFLTKRNHLTFDVTSATSVRILLAPPKG